MEEFLDQQQEYNDINRMVLQRIERQVVQADVTPFVQCILAAHPYDPRPFDPESASRRCTDPVCPYCGGERFVKMTSAEIAEQYTLDELENKACVYVPMGYFNADDDYVAPPTFAIEDLIGKEMLQCPKCRSLYGSLDELDYGCDTDDCVQWLMLSEDITDRLRKYGEVVFLETEVPLWGRCIHSGETELLPIWKEPALYHIAYDAGLLDGQKHCPYQRGSEVDG